MEIKVGQIWKENDPRFVRTFEVLEVGDLWIKIKGIESGRRTSANRNRFNGKARGYSLVR